MYRGCNFFFLDPTKINFQTEIIIFCICKNLFFENAKSQFFLHVPAQSYYFFSPQFCTKMYQKFLRKFSVLLNRQKDFVLQVSSFRVLLYFVFL